MSEAPPPRPPQPPSLEIPSDLEAVYANLVRISHTPSELVFDFARLQPGSREARVLTQVLMSPLSAKLFYRALAENLSRYEAAFGEISIPGDTSLSEYSKLFRPPPKAPEDPPGE